MGVREGELEIGERRGREKERKGRKEEISVNTEQKLNKTALIIEVD